MMRWIRWLGNVGLADVPLVGGKNASLGEMRRSFSALGVPVPDGFAVTAEAFRYFLQANALTDRIAATLADRNTALDAVSRSVRAMVTAGTLPPDLADEIRQAYRQLGGGEVAVRSSATAEDLPGASFAGAHETFLNVSGEPERPGPGAGVLCQPLYRARDPVSRRYAY